MYQNPWKWGWDSIAAIGQCLGAIATFTAVYVALRQNKPRLKIKANIISEKRKETILKVTVINISYIPITIESVGLKFPRKHEAIKELHDSLPKKLMPSEQLSIEDYYKKYQDRGMININNAFAFDNYGNEYHQNVKFLEVIKRFFWWKFSKFEW